MALSIQHSTPHHNKMDHFVIRSRNESDVTDVILRLLATSRHKNGIKQIMYETNEKRREKWCGFRLKCPKKYKCFQKKKQKKKTPNSLWGVLHLLPQKAPKILTSVWKIIYASYSKVSKELRNSIKIKVGQRFLSYWSKHNILTVLICNLKTAGPTKISVPFLSSLNIFFFL